MQMRKNENRKNSQNSVLLGEIGDRLWSPTAFDTLEEFAAQKNV